MLARFARRPLDLAARYGGEEFAIILFDTGRDARRAHRRGDHGGRAAARRSRTRIRARRQVLTISIGIACVVPAARRSWPGLVQLADQALYAAKDGGRNQARVLEAEYEHMKTGYFHRHARRSRRARQDLGVSRSRPRGGRSSRARHGTFPRY